MPSITFKIPEDLKLEIKRYCLESNTTLMTFCKEAVKTYLEIKLKEMKNK